VDVLLVYGGINVGSYFLHFSERIPVFSRMNIPDNQDEGGDISMTKY
jgi:hypothetical protein